MENMGENQAISTRNQLMVSSTTGENQLRLGYFIEPSFPSNVLPSFLPPRVCSSNLNSVNELNPPKPKFIGWQSSCQMWEEWVIRMHPHHESTWKTAGIYEAIMSSRFYINKDCDLVLALTNKWFSGTNTFVFGRQEYSITLEDVCVLGGYSVSGESILDPLDTNSREVDVRLMAARRIVNNSPFKKVTHNEWAKLFNSPDSNAFDDIAHEGFLVYWLSKFVFPNKYKVIGKYVHSLAIRLARGTRIALAPAVLASIYSDLKTLKNAFFVPSPKLELCSPMHLVQVWAWERFLLVEPNITVRGQQILARWENVISKVPSNITNILETAAFCFRPYEKFYKFHVMTHNMYPDEGTWVVDFSDLDIDAFVKFVRPCNLVGLDCVEAYHPHRVGMQFGYDQDIPGQVVGCSQDKDVAWSYYTRPFSGTSLYIPPKSAQTNITARYSEWWKRLFDSEAGPSTRR